MDRKDFLKVPNYKEKIMRMRNVLLASLFVPLYGCQPEAPTPKTAPPAMEQPPAPAAPPAAQPAAPAQVMEPAAGKAMQPAPAPATTAPAAAAPKPEAKTAPSPAAAAPAAPKPEAMTMAVVSEADFMQLAKKSLCLNCHSVDKKVVGPAFKDVAAKYRGDAGAEARMMEKIAKGGSGIWGAMMMPASPQVGEADRKTLVRYILSLK